MQKEEVLDLYDQQMRIDPHVPPNQSVEKTQHVVRALGTEFGTVCHSALNDENAYSVIREEIRYFEARGGDFEWKLYDHDEPKDLGVRLTSLGFVADERETVVYFDLRETLPEARQAPGVRIEKIDSPERFDALGLDDLLDELRTEKRMAPDLFSMYAVYVGDRQVAKGWIRFHPNRDFCDLWGGGTEEEFRGKGIYKMLVDIRMKEAKARGARFVTVDALPTSRPILQRLGFHILTGTTPYRFQP